MPEASVLYSVTAVVVAGLVVWVLVVLKTAKEPWTRAAPPALEAAGAPAPAHAEPALGATEERPASEAETMDESQVAPKPDADEPEPTPPPKKEEA